MSAALHRFEGLHFHVACGLGGGARGFNRAVARLGSLELVWRCIGGVDVDPAGLADFERLTGVKGALLDLFSREQYRAWHGAEPPEGWREATPEDFRWAAGGERPNLVFTSCPCKGNSGLLAESVSASPKYQALNELALRAMWLGLEAWADDPVEFYLFENVPRIATRSRRLLDQIMSLFRHFGYAGVETRHDCGELGGLAQTRKRFLGVFRHKAKVPPFLYEPPKRPLRGVGEVLERLPLPGDVDAGGPMHRMPELQWKTWVRLAFVEAGSDWRSLNRLAVEGGVLRDYGIAAEAGYQAGVLGVRRWEETTGTVAGRSTPTNGAFSVADPRSRQANQSFHQYGIREWDETAGTVTSQATPGGGAHSVADPRASGARFSTIFRIVPFGEKAPAVTSANAGTCAAVADCRPEAGRHVNGKWRVTPFDGAANTVIAAAGTGNGASVVADPRYGWGEGAHQSKLRVTPYDERANCVTGSDRVGSGAQCVADPRPRCLNADSREGYETGGHYGVVGWDGHTRAVPGFAKNNNGPWSVADARFRSAPRDEVRGGGGPSPAEAMVEGAVQPMALPAPNDRLVAVIRALDGTWHRPFTTLELAALQSLFDPDDLVEAAFRLHGKSDSAWRERIGNAVPPEAARAIATVMGRTLLAAWSGQSMPLTDQPVWVQPLAIALAVDVEGAAL